MSNWSEAKHKYQLPSNKFQIPNDNGTITKLKIQACPLQCIVDKQLHICTYPFMVHF